MLPICRYKVIISITTVVFAFLDALLTSVFMSCPLTVLCLCLRCGLSLRLIIRGRAPIFPFVCSGNLSVSSREDASCNLQIWAASFCNFTLHYLNRDCFVDTLAIWERWWMILLTVMFTLLFVSFFPCSTTLQAQEILSTLQKASFSFSLFFTPLLFKHNLLLIYMCSQIAEVWLRMDDGEHISESSILGHTLLSFHWYN